MLRHFLQTVVLMAGLITPPLVVPAFSLAAAVNPEASDLSVKLGEPATATIAVTNDGEKAASYHLSFLQAKFGKSADDLSLTLLDPALAAGISAKPGVFTLAPGETKQVSVTIALPKGYTVAPTIAILVIEDAPNGSVQTALTSLLFLHLKSGAVADITIENFQTIPGFSFGKPVVLSVVAQNGGTDTATMPREVKVFNIFGAEVDRFVLSAEVMRLPASTMRSVSASWPQAGRNFSPFVFGPYRFELWNVNQQLAVTRAWFLPSSTIGAFIIILGSVILGIIIFVRRRE